MGVGLLVRLGIGARVADSKAVGLLIGVGLLGGRLITPLAALPSFSLVTTMTTCCVGSGARGSQAAMKRKINIKRW